MKCMHCGHDLGDRDFCGLGDSDICPGCGKELDEAYSYDYTLNIKLGTEHIKALNKELKDELKDEYEQVKDVEFKVVHSGHGAGNFIEFHTDREGSLKIDGVNEKDMTKNDEPKSTVSWYLSEFVIFELHDFLMSFSVEKLKEKCKNKETITFNPQ